MRPTHTEADARHHVDKASDATARPAKAGGR